MKIHKIIYLQVKSEDGEELDEVTWCEDKVNSTDLKYELVKGSFKEDFKK